MSSLRSFLRAALVVIGMGSTVAAATAHAQVISSHTAGLDDAIVFPGQQVTTPLGGPWSQIRFSWFSLPTLPTAQGELFILTQAYLGLPSSLSEQTAGFLARSTERAQVGIEGSEYRFASDVFLLPNTTYWFFSNAQQTALASAGAYPGNDGGAYYEAPDGDVFTSRPITRLNYTLQGVPVGAEVPEPQTLALLVAGLLGIGVTTRRRAAARQTLQEPREGRVGIL